jgi:cell division septation protein DedD
MNKEILENKIAELLRISEEKKSLAFSVFKEKVAEFLNVGEALRIDNLGVFQLKEQLSQSGFEKSLYSNDKNITLVFSVGSDQSSEGPLFINLEIDNKAKDETEFNENIFQLGIGKPLVTNDVEVEAKDNIKTSYESDLKIKIESLLNNSEKLKDFDLWEDNLKSKGTKSILDEEIIIDESVDSILDEIDNSNIEKNILDEDFVPLGENEILDSYIEDNKFIPDDDVSNQDEDIEANDMIIKDSLEDVIDDIVEDEIEALSPEIDEHEEQMIVESDAIDEIINEEEQEKSFLDEIDMELNADEVESDEQLEVSTNVNNGELEGLKQSDDIDEKREIVADSAEDKIPKFGEDLEVKYKHSQKRRGSTIYFLFAAFVIVGAIGIYYLFFQNPTWLYDQHEVEVALSQEHAEELGVMKKNGSSNILDNNGLTETEELDNISKNVAKNNATDAKPNETLLTTNKAQIEADKVNQEIAETSIKDSDKSRDEEVAENIYYDGFVYNVQVSSWKQKRIAEREVAKLVKKDFPAFLTKVYIPKFDGTWYRVRLGPYTSISEAKNEQNKLNK